MMDDQTTTRPTDRPAYIARLWETTEVSVICRTCRWWAKRQGGVGWCDFNYPDEKRGLKQWHDACEHWEAADGV